MIPVAFSRLPPSFLRLPIPLLSLHLAHPLSRYLDLRPEAFQFKKPSVRRPQVDKLMGGFPYGYKERWEKVLPKLQKGCGEESSARKILPN
jgi:hypothetical protein